MTHFLQLPGDQKKRRMKSQEASLAKEKGLETLLNSQLRSQRLAKVRGTLERKQAAERGDNNLKELVYMQ